MSSAQRTTQDASRSVCGNVQRPFPSRDGRHVEAPRLRVRRPEIDHGHQPPRTRQEVDSHI